MPFSSVCGGNVWTSMGGEPIEECKPALGYSDTAE
jgi:hypothetical protein